MKIKVEMYFPGVRHLGGGDPDEKVLDLVSFVFSPKGLLCPFCRKPLKNARCCCLQFSDVFHKLQESLGDDRHASFISMKPTSLKSSSFTIKHQLVDKNTLNFDLFDEAFTSKDFITDRKYLVSEGSSEDGKTIIFYVKMLDSKNL